MRTEKSLLEQQLENLLSTASLLLSFVLVSIIFQYFSNFMLSLVTFGMTSQTHYYYTKVMTDLFNQQPDFMEGQLLGGLYWEYWYNNGDEK